MKCIHNMITRNAQRLKAIYLKKRGEITNGIASFSSPSKQLPQLKTGQPEFPVAGQSEGREGKSKLPGQICLLCKDGIPQEGTNES